MCMNANNIIRFADQACIARTSHSKIEIMRTYQPRISTDQVQRFHTSAHGQKILQGDTKVADCTSCHTSHTILSDNDPRSSVHPLKVPQTCSECHSNVDYMRGYRITTDQFEKYAQSIHGQMLLENKDTFAPACNDCHGNHGAMPPGAESVSHICGSCHANTMQYFAASPMMEELVQMDLHACEQCHGYHSVKLASDDMIGVGESSVCIECHESGDSGYSMAEEIAGHIKKLVTTYEDAEKKMTEVERKGMDDVEIGFALQEANQGLIKSRTLIHTFSADEVGKTVGEGLIKAEEAIAIAESEIKEHRTRRYGFGGATIFITILIVGLFIKIRQMEKQKLAAK